MGKTAMSGAPVRSDSTAGAGVVQAAAAEQRHRVVGHALVEQLADAGPAAPGEEPALDDAAQVAAQHGELHSPPPAGAHQELPVAEVADGDDHSLPQRRGLLVALPAV